MASVDVAGVEEGEAEVIVAFGEIRARDLRARRPKSDRWPRGFPLFAQGVCEVGEDIRIGATEVDGGLEGCGCFLQPVELMESEAEIAVVDGGARFEGDGFADPFDGGFGLAALGDQDAEKLEDVGNVGIERRESGGRCVRLLARRPGCGEARSRGRWTAGCSWDGHVYEFVGEFGEFGGFPPAVAVEDAIAEIQALAARNGEGFVE